MIWPVVLYPENVHRDFFGKQVISVEEQKLFTYAEMSNIHENISKELKPISNLIRVAVIIATDRVVNAELQDLIDIADVFFTLLDTVSEEVDAHVKKLSCPDSSKDIQDKVKVEKESVNIIQKILSAAAQDAEKSEIKVEAKDNLEVDFVPSKSKIDTFEERENNVVDSNSLVELSSNDKKRKNDHTFLSEKSKLKSWKDVCKDFESISSQAPHAAFDVKKYIADKIPALKHSLSVNDLVSSHEDYYMLPFYPDKTLEFQYKKSKRHELNFNEFSEVLIELDVSECLGDLLVSVIEYEQSEKDLQPCMNKSFPVYPGGGLVLKRDVLLSMEKEDPTSFPYSSFYQEILFVEKRLEKPKLIHIEPCYKESELLYDLTPISFEDFVLLNINDVLHALKAYNNINTTSLEIENQIRYS